MKSCQDMRVVGGAVCLAALLSLPLPARADVESWPPPLPGLKGGTVTLRSEAFLSGNYTTVCVLSPDEKFLYYLPGAHGKARNIGTPVVQYRIAIGERKVIAFLRDAFEKEYGYVPGGTYGVKLSADGATLYANLGGHPADPHRPARMRPNGLGLTAFAAIHIPESERQ